VWPLAANPGDAIIQNPEKSITCIYLQSLVLSKIIDQQYNRVKRKKTIKTGYLPVFLAILSVPWAQLLQQYQRLFAHLNKSFMKLIYLTVFADH